MQYIDFQKQSVESFLELLAKSLKIVFDEVHFIVNLFSFLLTPVLSGKPFSQVSHLPPSRQNNFQNSLLL